MSTRTIWKFELEMDRTITPPLCNPVPIFIEHDPSGSPCVWVEHDPLGRQVTCLTILMVGTGHTFSESDGVYVGSLVQNPFVWHFYSKAVTL